VSLSVASRVSNEVVRPIALPAEESKEIKVIGDNGRVTVNNAMGEQIRIYNVVGQLVADRTLSSDKETIAVPRGILIVKVGDSRTQKVIVK
jgi:hypothetical protein